MMLPVRAFAFSFAICLSATPTLQAQDALEPRAVQEGMLDELDRRTDELSDAARRTIEEFLNLVGPMLMQFSRLIDGLPAYETPEILPNGDIIIRRKPEPPALDDESEDGLTET